MDIIGDIRIGGGGAGWCEGGAAAVAGSRAALEEAAAAAICDMKCTPGGGVWLWQQRFRLNFERCDVQRWVIRWALGCVNPTSGLPLATGREFTQPRAHLCRNTST